MPEIFLTNLKEESSNEKNNNVSAVEYLHNYRKRNNKSKKRILENIVEDIFHLDDTPNFSRRLFSRNQHK